jgi:hypothetical protein
MARSRLLVLLSSHFLDGWKIIFNTPSVSFYLSLDSVKLHYPATNKKKRREYQKRLWRTLTCQHPVPCLIRACSVSSQSMWIEWDWMGLNPKQVKVLKNFFQSHSIQVYWE